MNIEEIQKHYWTDIIAMSKHYQIDPWKLVRIIDDWDDDIFLDNHPNFLAYDLTRTQITFAQTVIEGAPIFKWEKVYSHSGERYTVLDKVDTLGNIITISDEESEEHKIERTRLLLTSPKIVLQLHKRDIEVILNVFKNFDISECNAHFVREIAKVENTLREFTND